MFQFSYYWRHILLDLTFLKVSSIAQNRLHECEILYLSNHSGNQAEQKWHPVSMTSLTENRLFYWRNYFTLEKYEGWIKIEVSHFTLMLQQLWRDMAIRLLWRPPLQAIICCHLASVTQPQISASPDWKMVPESEMIAFTMHASAYAPSSHLVFHSLWQVGMSLGTVMTDSLCLPKVYGWRNRHWQLHFEAKKRKERKTSQKNPNKNRLHVSNPLSPTTNSPWNIKSSVCLMWRSHQVIIKRSPALLQIYLYTFHERSANVIYLSRVTQAVGIREGMNCGSHQGVFVIYLWQGEVRWPGHCIVKIFDNIWKTLTMKLWAKGKKNNNLWRKKVPFIFCTCWMLHLIMSLNIFSQHIASSSELVNLFI